MNWPRLSPADVQARIERASSAQRQWSTMSMEQRSEVLQRVASVLRDRTTLFAQRITEEMGKPIVQAEVEIMKCASTCDYFTVRSPTMLRDSVVETEYSSSRITYEAMGVVFGIMPWNFPWWQVIRFAAPALMAGNALLVKHAPTTFGCAADIEAVFLEAGAPEGLVSSLVINVDAVESVIAHRLVRAVTFTGSTAAGASVASLAGRYVKKSVLELGGSDPYIVLDDADIEQAAKTCVTGRLINTGQSCIAAKRFLVHRSIASAFTDAFIAEMTTRPMGDPMDRTTALGPLARRDLRDMVNEQRRRAVAAGGRLMWQCDAVPDVGFFATPAVLADVLPGNPAFDEEIFGPVAAISTFGNEDEAIRLANTSVYGLGAAVFTSDSERADRIARQDARHRAGPARPDPGSHSAAGQPSAPPPLPSLRALACDDPWEPASPSLASLNWATNASRPTVTGQGKRRLNT